MHCFTSHALRALVAAFAVAACALGTAPAGAAEDASRAAARQTAAIGQIVDDLEADDGKIWYCPMHPEVESHEPGRCPKCEMRLVRDPSDPH